MNKMRGRVEIILDGGRCVFGISSAIIDLMTSTPKILRRGAIPAEKILEAT